MATITYTYKTWDDAHEAMRKIWASGINCFTRFEYVNLNESKVHISGFDTAQAQVADLLK